MMNDTDELRARLTDLALRQAKEATSNRLALISAIIWLGAVGILYLVVWLPQGFRPSVATLWGLALLIPAGLPWVLYARILAAERRRRLADVDGQVSRRHPVSDS